MVITSSQHVLVGKFQAQKSAASNADTAQILSNSS